ncbi:family 16 glycosylhydrolase [Paenibacillus pasadenensis]|uniref:family 16 glycosylhydrolase n=1 Tax=Paenibacillus pasadenensis TaxID=217090 RepID=UPI00203B2A28|nr:family 16 glycosylhydrolase [Paenibacillus pasadenensis]MCM3747011.1 family 16 glycosylhydrolase [Paenibacillus pasadenensis]
MKKKTIVLGIGIAAAIGLSAAADEAQAAPPAGYSLVWSDEFEGTSLNEDEWGYRQNQNTLEQNVSVTDGVLELDMTKANTGFRGAGVTSKRTFGYGYYEVKTKWTNPGGFHPSAWTQIWDGQLPKTNSNTPFTEIDLFEDFEHQVNAGYLNWNSAVTNPNGGGDQYTSGSSSRKVYYGDHESYHTYAVDYQPTYMTFYKDDAAIGTFTYGQSGAAMPHNSPMVFYLSTIPYGTNPDPNRPAGYVYGTMYVDYFKYYTATGTMPVTTPAAPSPHNPVRSDNFESGVLSNWNLASGTWDVLDDGSKRMRSTTSSGTGMALYNDKPASSSSWSDSTVETNIKFNGLTGSAGVIGRVSNNNNSFYYLRLNSVNSMLELVRYNNSTNPVLANVPVTVTAGKDYRLKLSMDGPILKGYLNGAELLSVEDEAYALGYAGVRSWNQALSIDDFRAARIMFSDDLESGNASKWKAVNGLWSVTADGTNILQNSSTTGESLTVANSANYNNASVSAKIKLLTSGGYASVVGRYADNNNFYFLRLDKAAGKLAISKKSGGLVTELNSVPVTVNVNQWYRLELSYSGGALKGFLNGEEKLSVTDSAPLSGGKAGIRGYNASYGIDEFTIEAR